MRNSGNIIKNNSQNPKNAKGDPSLQLSLDQLHRFSDFHLRLSQEGLEYPIHSSFQMSNITFLPRPSPRSYDYQVLVNEYEPQRPQCSQVEHLSLYRGRSQSYEYLEAPEFSLNERMLYSRQEIIREDRQLGTNCLSGLQLNDPSYLPRSYMEQEFQSQQKSSSQLRQAMSSEGEVTSNGQIGLKVTKNVTKNIGKLLFKFIWKNRRTLWVKMGLEKSRWESFIRVISLWKKQNNITRQYLIRLWHSEGEDSALFRMISRHFFRKRCLPAILKSHIRLKQVHYQRIPRFSAAIADPTALDSLT